MSYTFTNAALMTIADQYVMGLTPGQLYELWCKYIDINDELMEHEWDMDETPATNIFQIIKRRYYNYLTCFTWATSDLSPVYHITSFEDFLDKYDKVMDERAARIDRSIAGDDNDDD